MHRAMFYGLRDPDNARSRSRPVAGHQYAKFGIRLGPDDIPALGVRVLKAEREFNGRQDLPKRMIDCQDSSTRNPCLPITRYLRSVTRRLIKPLTSNGIGGNRQICGTISGCIIVFGPDFGSHDQRDQPIVDFTSACGVQG